MSKPKRDKRGGAKRRAWRPDQIRINGEQPDHLAEVVKPEPAELRRLQAEIKRRALGG